MLNWDEIQNESLEFLRKLVAFNTSNPPGGESEAVSWIDELLRREGLEPVVVSAAPGRDNLVVRLKGRGRSPSLLLDSHIDVVGTNPDEWKVPPFSGEIRDGFVWGRGTLDMKHMTAMSLSVVLTIVRNRLPLAGDLVLAVTADEENGAQLGAFYLAQHHPDLIRTDYALGEVGGISLTVGNRRIFPIQVAEKGICWLRITVEGEGGHGSIPRRSGTLRKVARVLDLLHSLRFPIAPHPAARAFIATLADESGGAAKIILNLVKGGKCARPLLASVVPGSKAPALLAMLSHTCQPTVVSCGDRVNVSPSSAEILADCRLLPGSAPEEMQALIQRRLAGLARVEMVAGHRGHAITHNNPLYRHIANTVSSMDPGAVTTPYLMPGFTNGAAYASLGTMYMGFTPVLMPPTLDYNTLFHAPNERIPVDGFKWGVRTLFETAYGFLAD